MYEEQEQQLYSFVDCYEFLKDKLRILLATDTSTPALCIPGSDEDATEETATNKRPIGCNAAKKQRKDNERFSSIASEYGINRNNTAQQQVLIQAATEMKQSISNVSKSIKDGIAHWMHLSTMLDPLLLDEKKKELTDKYYSA